MNITKDNTTKNIETVKFNGTSVQKITKDGTIVWAKRYTITFTNPTYGTWGSATKNAYYGDTLSKSGNVVTCTKYSGGERWTNTCTQQTTDAQYTYSVNSISIPSATVVSAQTITATSSPHERSYNVTFTKGDYGSWSDNGAAITALYSATISLNDKTVTVGSASRTYSLTANTVEFKYTTTISNASGTVGTGKNIVASDGRSTNKYSVSITAGDGIKRVYLSTSSTDTGTGNASSTSTASYNYNYNTTVYGFAVLKRGYNANSGWGNPISGTVNSEDAIYCVGSILVKPTGTYAQPNPSSYNFNTINANIKQFNVSISSGGGLADVWLSTSSSASSTTNVTSANYDYGATVYGYVKLAKYYTAPSAWGSPISGTANRENAVYRIGSKTIDLQNESFYATATGNTYTINAVSITGGTVYWTKNSNYTGGGTELEANYNDKVYWYIVASTGYDLPAQSNSNGSINFTRSNFSTFSEASGGRVTYGGSISNCIRITWTLSVSYDTNKISSYKYKIGSGSWVTGKTGSPLTFDYSDTVTIRHDGVMSGYTANSSEESRSFANCNSSRVATVTVPDPTRITWSLAVTMSNYITSWRYKINNGDWTTKTSDYTITGIDYGWSVTIEGTGNEGTAGYTYGSCSGAGTFAYVNGNSSTTLSCSKTRITWSLAVTQSDYVTSWRYKIISGGDIYSGNWTTNQTSSKTITGIDYANQVIIECLSNEGDSGYTYGSFTGGGTFGSGAQSGQLSTTLSCTRTRKTWSFKIYKGNYCTGFKYRKNSEALSGGQTSTVSLSNLDYADTVYVESTGNDGEAPYNYYGAYGTGTFRYNTASTTVYYTRDVKSYTLTLNVSDYYCSWSVWRTDSPYANAGELIFDGNGQAAIYYGDKISYSATANETRYGNWDYNEPGDFMVCTGSWNGGACTSPSITVTAQNNAPASLYYWANNTWVGLASNWCNKSGYNNSYTLTGLAFNTTYTFHVAGNKYRSYWTRGASAAISGDYDEEGVYGDCTVTINSWENGAQTESAWVGGNPSTRDIATGSQNSYTITFNTPTYGSWGSTTKTAYWGDYITVSGTTVYCKAGGSSGSDRWSNTLTANSDECYDYWVSINSGDGVTISDNYTITTNSGCSAKVFTLSYSTSVTGGNWGTISGSTPFSYSTSSQDIYVGDIRAYDYPNSSYNFSGYSSGSGCDTYYFSMSHYSDSQLDYYYYPAFVRISAGRHANTTATIYLSRTTKCTLCSSVTTCGGSSSTGSCSSCNAIATCGKSSSCSTCGTRSVAVVLQEELLDI